VLRGTPHALSFTRLLRRSPSSRRAARVALVLESAHGLPPSSPGAGMAFTRFLGVRVLTTIAWPGVLSKVTISIASTEPSTKPGRLCQRLCNTLS
jgi:hypothetical protein